MSRLISRVAFASACGLAVVRDTGSGCDQIENWPDLAFVDWLLDAAARDAEAR